MNSEQITQELKNLPTEQRLDFASYLDNEGIGYAIHDGYFNGLSPELMNAIEQFKVVYQGFADFLSDIDWDEEEETCY